MIRGSRVEIDICVQFLVALHELFNLVRHVEPLGLANGLAEVAGHSAEVSRARIFGVIDAMAKAGDLFLLRQHGLDILDRIGPRCVNRLQDMKCGFVGTAVQRPFERADRRGDGGVHVRQRCRRNPRRKC